jgi:hypothetical protein
MEALNNEMQSISQDLYSQAGAEQAAGEAGGSEDSSGNSDDSDDIIDAEVVDDEK